MIQYPIADLMKKADCRYTLVIVVAKRARMLTEHKQVSPLDEYDPENIAIKPVDIAVKEVMDGRVTYVNGDEHSRREADALHLKRQFEQALLGHEVGEQPTVTE